MLHPRQSEFHQFDGTDIYSYLTSLDNLLIIDKYFKMTISRRSITRDKKFTRYINFKLCHQKNIEFYYDTNIFRKERWQWYFTRTVYTGTKQFSFTLKYPRDEMADRRRDWSRDRVRLTHLITTDPVSWHRVDTLVHAYFSPRSTRTAPQKMSTRKKENGLVRR